jgi:hypothetical protein
MSYDLFFTNPEISRDQFTNYFSQRPSYGMKGDQAIYQNKDTGVYFIFDFNGPEKSDPEAPPGSVSFNLNYFRPHFFGLEAAPEVEGFVSHFGFSIHDPQTEGMGEGPFSTEGFLKGWNIGNKFGYSAILRNKGRPSKIWTWPGHRLESVWRWNYAKKQVQAAFEEEDTFVPGIFLLNINEHVASVVVWPDAISELIPEVDYLVIGRDELAPKSFFGRKKQEKIIVPFDHCRELLLSYQTSGYSLPTYLVPTGERPPHLLNFVTSLGPSDIDGDGLGYDQVLNEEIVQEVSAG